ncbi:aminoacyl-tRNA hydrolase [Corynebacterium frankenforstense]|uniref:aminoacyl-tRNA hydrolase n=1 Tax=Corynebacterium frankenforstense TaxID=1230998 RepID=UPI000A4EB616|nr:aminoacyl-tRNA hydrolase [Corynebacterium frankenforstense]
MNVLQNLLARLRPAKPAPERAPQPAAPEHADWLVVGLGNPGAQYEATRHNAGHMVLDELADTDLSECAGATVVTVRPRTYMNLSGEGVAPLARRLGVPAERVIVVHDELDLAPGVVRVRAGGSENGHRGLKSLTEHLGTRDYLRVRVGVGRPPQGMSVPDWVLAPIDDAASADLGAGVALAARAVELILAEGLTAAQNEIHRRLG